MLLGFGLCNKDFARLSVTWLHFNHVSKSTQNNNVRAKETCGEENKAFVTRWALGAVECRGGGRTDPPPVDRNGGRDDNRA